MGRGAVYGWALHGLTLRWSSVEELLESVSGEAACESMHPSAELSLVLDANNKWVGETQVGWCNWLLDANSGQQHRQQDSRAVPAQAPAMSELRRKVRALNVL